MQCASESSRDLARPSYRPPNMDGVCTLGGSGGVEYSLVRPFVGPVVSVELGSGSAGGDRQLENQLRHVDVGEEILCLLCHQLGVDEKLVFHSISRVERDVLENSLHYSVQPPRAYVLNGCIDLGGDARNLLQRRVIKLQVHPFRSHQCSILPM